MQRHWEDGYMTVFLSLILSVMLSLALMLIWGARENTRRMEIECVTDIGMNSVLAEYHRQLLEQYDLFFIDTAYGTGNPSYARTEERLRYYAEYNLSGDEIFLSVLYRDLLKLKVTDAEIVKISVSSDDGGAVLRRQAVEVMKQKTGIAYLEQIRKWTEKVTECGLDTRDIPAEQMAAAAELEAWDGAVIEDESGERTITVDSPGENVVSFWQAGILNLVADKEELSAAEIDPANYLTSRERLAGTGMRDAADFEDNEWDRLFFQEYIMAYTGNYREKKEESLLAYQTEYIVAGSPKDVENLREVVQRIALIRAAADLITLLSDEEKMELIDITSELLAAVITLPELAPLIKTVIILSWTMAEALYDTSALLSGKRVPLIKSKEEWHYSLEQMFGFGGSVEEKEQGSGLCYEDYLRIFLCFADKQTMTYRLMDIMEMDIRRTEGNGRFRMDGCIDSLTAVLSFRGKDGREYSITRSYGY